MFKNYGLLTGESREEQKSIIKNKTQEKFKELETAFNLALSTKEGMALGKWLMEQCGFLENSIVSNADGILQTNTIYNEARRGIYLELRRYLNSETLINLEIKK